MTAANLDEAIAAVAAAAAEADDVSTGWALRGVADHLATVAGVPEEHRTEVVDGAWAAGVALLHQDDQ